MKEHEPIYKVVSRDLWVQMQSEGIFTGAPVDEADGFIHFSTGTQVRETVAKHFAGQTDLLIVSVDPDALGESLVWEPSRGGALFPHLYGTLEQSAVTKVQDLPLGPDGSHIFPEEI